MLTLYTKNYTQSELQELKRLLETAFYDLPCDSNCYSCSHRNICKDLATLTTFLDTATPFR